MEFETKEFTIRFLDERIIVLEQKKSIGRMTKEGAIECAEKMIDLCNSNANSKVIVFHVGSLYIKKDVMRVFSDQPAHESVICIKALSTAADDDNLLALGGFNAVVKFGDIHEAAGAELVQLATQRE